MVTIRGIEIQRTPKPNKSITAPASSADMDNAAMSLGNGRPSPQSGLPNHAAVLWKLVSLLVPAIQKIGAR